MKLTLINVSMSGSRSTDAMEPLAFAVMKGLTPSCFEVEFYDERIERLPDKLDTDWVILSANTFSIKRAYWLASLYQKENIKIAIGGFHTTLLPEETMAFADATFIGDAEGIWPDFLEDLISNTVKPVYKNQKYPCIVDSKFDTTVFSNKGYNIIKPVQYSRGCPYDCDFCSISAVYKKSLRYRNLDNVVDEIKRRKLRYVFFVDDNLFTNRVKIKAFLQAIEPLGIKWTCQISIEIGTDDELLMWMAKSGCIAVLIGFETTNLDNLSQMNKQTNLKHMNYTEIIDRIKSYGLMIYGTFVLGYDHDDLHAFDKTLEFALDHRLLLANFNPLIPTPGTSLYKRLEEENRLIYKKWWLEEGYTYGQTVFLPKQMSPEELSEGCFRIRKAFNSYRNIALRMFENRQNFSHPVIYLTSNLISRKEILKKQGRTL